jgi:adenylate kinase family enzyme
MRRIAIIGPPGSGKSRLARQLGETVGIRVIHLDRLFWKPNWVETPPAEWEAIQRRELGGDSWIVDGPAEETAHLWLDTADTIVFIDASPASCLWRVARRRLSFEDGPEMPAGCEPAPLYQALPKFVSYLWTYSRTTRSEILADLARRDGSQTVVRLRRGSAVRAFLADAGDRGTGKRDA